MKVIIVEDEPLAARNLEKILSNLADDLEVEKILSSVKECIEWFGKNDSPDLIFMDIQLSDGISFDLFKSVQIDSPIIFTTAYNDYALRAFKVNSIDYLLKPIDKEELALSLTKFRKWKSEKPDYRINEQIQQLIRDINLPKEAKKYKERFLVWFKHSVVPIDQNNVSHFVKDELIYLRTMDGQKYITDFNTMEEIEEILNHSLFFRANRQNIIHVHSVDSYQSGVNGKLVVKLKAPISSELEISREKAGAFKEWLS